MNLAVIVGCLPPFKALFHRDVFTEPHSSRSSNYNRNRTSAIPLPFDEFSTSTKCRGRGVNDRWPSSDSTEGIMTPRSDKLQMAPMQGDIRVQKDIVSNTLRLMIKWWADLGRLVDQDRSSRSCSVSLKRKMAWIGCSKTWERAAVFSFHKIDTRSWHEHFEDLFSEAFDVSLTKSLRQRGYLAGMPPKSNGSLFLTWIPSRPLLQPLINQRMRLQCLIGYQVRSLYGTLSTRNHRKLDILRE